MKRIFYIAVMLLLVSCNNKRKNNYLVEKTIVSDTVATAEHAQYKTDTITKTSKIFPLNKLMCYWKHSFIIYDYGNDQIGLDITMQLKESKTNKTILEYEFSPKYPEDYDFKSKHYFDVINKRHLADMNFDGFKDFTIYSPGSMPMTSSTNIYLFNKKTKTFDISDLSDTHIEEIDSLKKILTTSSFDMERVYFKKHHFDKKGKIKFSEHISEEDFYPNDTTQKRIRINTKMINNKEVETKIDTIKE